MGLWLLHSVTPVDMLASCNAEGMDMGLQLLKPVMTSVRGAADAAFCEAKALGQSAAADWESQRRAGG